MSVARTKRFGEYQEGMLWYEHCEGYQLRVGLTEQAIDELGTIGVVELPEEGNDFDEGSVVACVRGEDGDIDITIPVAGIINKVNLKLFTEPELINSDNRKTWIFEFEASDITELEEVA